MSKTGLQKSVDQLLFHDNKLSAESKNKLIKEEFPNFKLDYNIDQTSLIQSYVVKVVFFSSK